eukprot:COSAG02_NODE_6807_length_3350_cov_6.640111_3_plen_118_part_00
MQAAAGRCRGARARVHATPVHHLHAVPAWMRRCWVRSVGVAGGPCAWVVCVRASAAGSNKRPSCDRCLRASAARSLRVKSSASQLSTHRVSALTDELKGCVTGLPDGRTGVTVRPTK